MIIHAHELVGELRQDYRIDPLQKMIGDRVYVPVDEDWFDREFAEALRVLLSELRLGGWISERNDCDDLAGWGRLLAQRLHAGTPPREGVPMESAIAIGEFWYFRNGNQVREHSLIIARFANRKVGFMHGQTQERVTLTEPERISCTGLRF